MFLVSYIYSVNQTLILPTWGRIMMSEEEGGGELLFNVQGVSVYEDTTS